MPVLLDIDRAPSLSALLKAVPAGLVQGIFTQAGIDSDPKVAGIGSLASAGKVGLAVIVFGTAVYYIHERLWVRAGWGRNIEGFDYVKRSVVKTIIYRGLTMVIAFLIAKAFITGSNANAAAFSIAQALTNMCLFFIVERVFNKIAWGKSNDQT
jgi:uncharacterized membrane protein